MATSSNKRITILNPSEIDQLYRLPGFTAAERTEYFTLSDEEEEIVARLRSLETKAYFILLLGYFRVKPVIVHFRFREVREDLHHIISRYFPGSTLPRGDLARNIKSTLYQKLLETVHFSSFTPFHKATLLKRLRDVATVCVDPRYLFDECLAYFSHERIALIRYTSLQTLVSLALRDERQRVEQIIKTQVKDSTKMQLRSLLMAEGAISTLARLRKTAKDFSTAELDKELDNHHTIQGMYDELKAVVARLKLSAGNLDYYSSLVDYYTVSKLRRFDETKAFLYLVCYLTVRYRQIHDNLAVAFRHLVRKQYESAKANAKERVMAELAIIQDNIKAAGQALSLYVEATLPNELSFGQVRKQAFQLISPHAIQLVSTHIDQSGFDTKEYEWQYIERHHQAGTQLRKLFLAMDLNCQRIGVAFAKQVDVAQSELAEFGRLKTVDQRLISKRHKPYLCDAGTVQSRRVEFLLYRQIARHLQTGGVTLHDSERHRHLEDDLISASDWQRKNTWLAKSGLPRFTAPIEETLQTLQDTLETKVKHVCDRIAAGENRYVVFADSGNTNLKWSIPHKKDSHAVNHPFFNQIIHMDIVDVMRFVHRRTRFLTTFSHIAGNQGEAPVRPNDLLACIIANGTNFGLSKLANISDRSLGKLRSVHDNYVRLETLKEANDTVANAVTCLPIFRHYHVDRHQVFASIDGQKFETRINTFKARFSA
ncbi:MAG: DUF4158 domain-containing protein, partial [Pseudomonadales bacterium]